MAEHLIDHDFQAQPVSLRHQPVEVGQGSIGGIDAAVVGDVVAEVLLGRGEEGRQPDGVHAKLRHIGQAAGDALQVADAVTVAVLEGARVDLVNDGAAPPVRIARCQLGGCGC